MEALAEMDLGFLLAQVSDDPDSLRALLVNEIERSLPDIISHLRIPPPVSKNYTKMIESRLSGKPGFRRYNATERKRVVQQLEDESFLRNLRLAQERYSNGVQAGTAKRARAIPTDYSDGTGFVVDPVQRTAPGRTSQFHGPFAPHKQGRTNMIVTSVTSQGLQGELPLEISEDSDARTARIEKDIAQTTLEVPDIPIELQEPLADRDIRDLLALIKSGRLVGFIEPSVQNLLPKGVNKIRVPRTRIYAGLDLENLIAEYHKLAISDLVSRDLADELQLLDGLIVAMEHEAQWSRINTRRFHLINKKHSIGLKHDEKEELDALDQLAQKQMYAVQNLPFAELAMLKVYARRLGFEEDTG